MTQGLATTFRVLTHSDSESAGRVLLAALESPTPEIQESALTAVLRRRDQGARRELLRRWEQMNPRWRVIIKRNRDCMDRVLREAVLGDDVTLGATACEAAIWLSDYDLVTTLLTALGEGLHPNADLLARTLLALADQLYEELADPRPDASQRDPQRLRQHVVSTLEQSVQRYGRHKRREVLEAFLSLAPRDNAMLRQVLLEPHHAAFLVTLDVLAKSSRPGVMRLLLSFLDDPHAPSAALSIVGNRCDLTFLRHVLRKIGRDPSPIVRQNLKRIGAVAWIRSAEACLQELDEQAQHAAVRMIVTSAIPRAQIFALLESVLKVGKPAGRRAAAEALAEFNGAEANALALKALGDPDPQVQAAIILQLRRRGIPGVLARLVELLESPHPAVRQAARKSLAEFTFHRYLGAFDMLDDDVRRSTGALVKKVDPQILPLLRAEMLSKIRTRRHRALLIARAVDLVYALEPLIIDLLKDEDHMVRAEAASVLASCSSEASRDALRDALDDHSPAVQEAVRRSLTARNEFLEWRSGVADPRD